MKDWSTDKIVGTGLVISLMLSIVVGIWTGNGVELQTTIASGLIGFMGRVAMEKGVEHSTPQVEHSTPQAEKK